MSTAAARSRYTPEEYLALERQTESKNEYIDGQIHAMSGATLPHNLVAGNIYTRLNIQIWDRPCRAFMGDMRVCVSPTGLYTYPDVTVVCGEPQLLDDHFDTLLNPTVIVEVLSPSTEAYDRGDKFAHYRRLASLQEYVLVAQNRVHVERYARQGKEWLLTEFNQLDDVLRLASIDCEVALRDVYAKVPFLNTE
ncbi:MAG: Uma2 family endonuclease [Isosphaeraceae bacterium]